MTEHVTWHRFTPGTEDEYGEQSAATYSDVLLHEQDGQSVAFAPETGPVGGAEPRDGTSQRVVTEASLYLDIPIAYEARDQFTVRGVRFEVEGESQGGWENPYTGWGAGQQITLRKVTG